jgi:hypothetical protein
MSQWPDTIVCENSACGKKISTQHEKFTLVTYAGNVEFNAGHKKKSGNCAHVLCEKCTRISLGKFKRKNKILEGINMTAKVSAVLLCLLFLLAGCTSLDREGTRQNDENVQVTTKENDENNDKLVELKAIDSTVKKSRDERNKSSRNLARQMARAAGNKDLPEDPEQPNK